MIATASVDQLGSIAANATMLAAVEYLRSRNVRPTDGEYHALTASLRAHCKAALFAAIDDAKAAFEAGMVDAGNATFLASMRLAGIRAAQEVFPAV